MISVARVN